MVLAAPGAISGRIDLGQTRPYKRANFRQARRLAVVGAR